MVDVGAEVVFIQHRRGWRKTTLFWGRHWGGEREAAADLQRSPAVSLLQAHVIQGVAPVAIAGGAADGADLKQKWTP